MKKEYDPPWWALFACIFLWPVILGFEVDRLLNAKEAENERHRIETAKQEGQM